MSGTVPPPPPGHDGRPPSVPPASSAADVHRVPSAYEAPAAVDPMAEVPLQQVTAPSAAATVHAPVPPPPDAGPRQAAPPVYQPTQQIPPATAYGHQPTQQVPAYAAQPAGYAAYAAQPAPPAPGAAYAPAGAYAAGGAAAAPPPPPPEPRRRRRLSAGWIAFIAVDVVLAVVAVAFAVQILTSSSPSAPAADANAATSPSPSVSASQEAPMQGEALAHFAAPSKNITCSIYADGASCGIAELNQQPVPAEDCDGTQGYVVTVDSEGEVAQPCVPASEQPKAAGNDVDVLEYGDTITEGDYTCTSEDTGMSCTHDPSGKGFSLARAGIGTSQ